MKKKTVLQWLQILSGAVMVILIILILWNFHDITLDELMTMIPENKFLAVLCMLALFAIKSMAVFMPILLLQAASGLLFPLPAAILLNIAGAAVGACVGYIMGRLYGGDGMDAFVKKYPKAGVLIERYRNSELFFSYILRAVGCLPMDVVSILLGSMRVHFGRFLAGTLLGMLPGTLAVTILGFSVTDPSSPLFICAVAANFVIAGVSLWIFRSLTRSRRKKTGNSAPHKF